MLLGKHVCPEAPNVPFQSAVAPFEQLKSFTLSDYRQLRQIAKSIPASICERCDTPEPSGKALYALPNRMSKTTPPSATFPPKSALSLKLWSCCLAAVAPHRFPHHFRITTFSAFPPAPSRPSLAIGLLWLFLLLFEVGGKQCYVGLLGLTKFINHPLLLPPPPSYSKTAKTSRCSR